MNRPHYGSDWLRLVLEADGLSEYRDSRSHHHRVDWLGRSASALSMALVGFLIVAAALGMASSRPSVTAEQDALRERVQAEQERTRAVEAAYLRARADLARTQSAVRPDLDGALARELDRQSLAAGYVALRGPGVVLVLDDAAKPTYVGSTNLGLIIDRDVQHAVNALWAAGAEAVSVDGIRLTTRTPIRNAGPSVLVDYRPVTTPIEIRAVGDAAGIARRFRAAPEWQELSQLRDRYGVQWSFTTRDRLTVPAGEALLPTVASVEGAP